MMIKLYYLFAEAITYHIREKWTTIRTAFSLILYFTGTIVLFHLCITFKLILKFVSEVTRRNTELQTVDTTPFLQTFLMVITYSLCLFFIGLVLFGVAQFTINTQRLYLTEKKNLTICQLTGGSTSYVTLQFFLNHYLLIPIIFPISIILSNLLIKAIIIGGQKAFNFDEIPGLTSLSMTTLFITISILIMISIFAVNFSIVYRHLKKLNVK